MIGEKFGRWTVIKYSGTNKHGAKMYVCQCECGAIKTIVKQNLINGISKSCGCLRSDVSRKRQTTHGKYHTRLYSIWANMRNRCNLESATSYKWYGAKGIKVCTEWDSDFMSFYNWAMSNGYEDNLTIDRVDSDSDYSPENCRWVTPKVQGNNTSRNRNLTLNGITKTLTEWAEENSIKPATLWKRIHDGKHLKESLSEVIKIV